MPSSHACSAVWTAANSQLSGKDSHESTRYHNGGHGQADLPCVEHQRRCAEYQHGWQVAERGHRELDGGECDESHYTRGDAIEDGMEALVVDRCLKVGVTNER